VKVLWEVGLPFFFNRIKKIRKLNSQMLWGLLFKMWGNSSVNMKFDSPFYLEGGFARIFSIFHDSLQDYRS
jgi:hypothetical protein